MHQTLCGCEQPLRASWEPWRASIHLPEASRGLVWHVNAILGPGVVWCGLVWSGAVFIRTHFKGFHV